MLSAPDAVSPEDLRGLTGSEARTRLEREGPNVLVASARKPSIAAWIAHLFSDPMAILLVITSGTYLVLGDRVDAVVAGIALAPIFLVSAVLERRSEVALERLRDFTAPTARVRRDGALVVVPARDVVRGDVMHVQEGDVVVADGRLVDGLSLTFDESPLTGESIPAMKTAAGTGDERTVLAGTTLLAGRGLVLVTSTGRQTRYGRIGGLLGEIAAPATPIERAIRGLVVQIGIAVALVCVGVVAMSRLHGDAWPVAIIAAVSLAMAAIPEELPMVYTLYLALGAWRLAKDDALVRRLGSVETLGAANVICTDKTGTITFGRIELVETLAGGPESEAELLGIALLASESDSFDPLEQAIERYARGRGLANAQESGTLVSRESFDSRRKYSAATWEIEGRRVEAKKGAIEVLSAKGDRGNSIALGAERMALQGMRVIAVAKDDRLIGALGFADVIRPDIAQSIDECTAAGIRVIMITGDHPMTACAVAKTIGLETGAENVLTGDTMDALDEAQLAEVIGRVHVIARAHPEQKLRIVRALQASGCVVAMTGDGTNDALALRHADIGIAMGQRGTEVARSAADIVLLNDDFSTIVRAVRNGRRIFENMRRAFSYLVAFHAPLLCSAVFVPLFGAPLLLLPIHLVLLEIIVHPTSSLVFEADPAAPDTMRKPPRPPGVGFFRPSDWVRPIVLGGVLSLAVLLLYLSEVWGGTGTDIARTVGIIAMITGQSAIVLVERSPMRPFWSGFRLTPVLALVLAPIAVLPLIVYVPVLANGLHMAPPDAQHWLFALLTGLAAALWFEPIKVLLHEPA